MAEHDNPFHAALWDSDDSKALRIFLKSKTGKRLITRLRIDRPLGPSGTLQWDLNANAMHCRDLTAYDQCLENIFDYLVTEPSKAESTRYPTLDDDTGWDEVDASLRAVQRPMITKVELPKISPEDAPPNEAELQMVTEPPDKKE
jgi:hypothetical protein